MANRYCAAARCACSDDEDEKGSKLDDEVQAGVTRGVTRNADADWARFDPDVYFRKNYADLRDDDRQILRITADHFCKCLPVDQRSRRAVDVGAGVNLYPALAMLPFCASITLYEYAPSNLAWLHSQRGSGWAGSWKDSAGKFWAVLDDLPHGEISEPLQQLSDQIEIEPGSLFDLDPEVPWDLGTMFFVAESITEDRQQFEQGIDRFLGALKARAPYVIAFMEGRTEGYCVAGESFPSTAITKADVESYLGRQTQLDRIERIEHTMEPVVDELSDRPYTGMVVACGRTSARTGRVRPS